MKIVKATLPNHSVLKTTQTKYDYTDSFKGQLHDADKKITSTDIGKAFFSTGPQWISGLFTLRNKIVALFGLKTSENKKGQEELKHFTCEVGDQVGLFKVFNKTENEVVLGEDDKHLDFKVSLYIAQINSETKCLTISTTVIFHNWFGKLYFLPVRFFHKLIVPTMLKGIINQLEKTNTNTIPQLNTINN
ncbi:DUF2867 domain-containing protein [Plebeiibacterium sediminum]|uniref:DUF2867 domain-containing protein n=1 Tax=Plebeiibacterium sediminum TaxID=2992112 RepID=A0AAE3M5D1_9BACT|nr:DUF2867 domain-containing protein [Plebeiobacterium sediminum]MCW3787454.1 DUF2867 domain-containing protein [Plebeiobacterium sediminum]